MCRRVSGGPTGALLPRGGALEYPPECLEVTCPEPAQRRRRRARRPRQPAPASARGPTRRPVPADLLRLTGETRHQRRIGELVDERQEQARAHAGNATGPRRSDARPPRQGGDETGLGTAADTRDLVLRGKGRCSVSPRMRRSERSSARRLRWTTRSCPRVLNPRLLPRSERACPTARACGQDPVGPAAGGRDRRALSPPRLGGDRPGSSSTTGRSSGAGCSASARATGRRPALVISEDQPGVGPSELAVVVPLTTTGYPNPL